MKKYSIYFSIAALILASLACQTLLGSRDSTSPVNPLPPIDSPEDFFQPTEESSQDFDYSSDSANFPLPDDASNVVSFSNMVNFQTKLSLEEVMAFYRDVYGKQGLTEREIVTVVYEGVFSMTFDGDPSGKAIVIQGVDLGDGNVTVTIILEDV